MIYSSLRATSTKYDLFMNLWLYFFQNCKMNAKVKIPLQTPDNILPNKTKTIFIKKLRFNYASSYETGKFIKFNYHH